MSKIQAVVFDWSGTVSDDRRLVYEANMLIWDHFNIPRIPFEEFIPQVEMTVEAMAKKFKIPAEPRQIARLYQEGLATLKRGGTVPTPYPGALEILKEMTEQGVRLAVLSSHPQNHLQIEAEEFGFTPLLARLFGSSTDKVQGLREVLDALGILDPSGAVFVGDTVFDVQSAKAVGARSIAVSHGYHTRKRLAGEHPDLVLQNIKMLAGIV